MLYGKYPLRYKLLYTQVKLHYSVSRNRLNLKQIHVMIKAEKILRMRGITSGALVGWESWL